MSGRGRGSRGGPLLSSRGRGSRSASPSSLGGLKRGSRLRGRGLPLAHRRPKFNDNPPAPEIVEKRELNGGSNKEDLEEEEDAAILQDGLSSSEEEEENHPLLHELKTRLQDGSVRDLVSLKSAVSESLSAVPVEPLLNPLSNAVKELFMSHAPESLAEEGLSYLKSRFSEATLVPLDQLDRNMVPVEAVHIQEFRVQGDEKAATALSLNKTPSSFDKSALFSKMEDTFAKDTQQALKHKPVYTKKSASALPNNPPDNLLDNKENERLKNGPLSSPSPPLLLPEIQQSSYAAANSPLRGSLQPPSAAEMEEEEQEEEEPQMMWPAVLSRMDAETAALALQFTLSKPSLKTVIRVPPSTASSGPAPPKSKKKRLPKAAPTSPPPTAQEQQLPPSVEEDACTESSLVIDEEEGGDEQHSSSPRSSPVTPHHHLNNSSSNPPSSLTPYSSGKASSPDSHKSDEKAGPPESMVVPEKASSFNIHPERCCSDMCHYCGLKFGMLDTPLHVSQLKTSEVRKKVEDITGFEKDACLCDKCFRFLDRRAKQGEDLSAAAAVNAHENRRKREESKDDHKCIVRNCNREVSENVSKKWLVRLKKKLVRKISLDWERIGRGSVKSAFPVCHKHHSWVDFYSSCGLCKKKLTVGGICTLGISKQEVHELNVLLREDRIPAELVENHFVCKLCRTFCNFKQKSALSPEVFRNQKAQKGFCKDYKKRLYQCLRLDGGESTEAMGEDVSAVPTSSSSSNGSKTPKKIHQVSQSDNPTKITIKTTTLPLEDEESLSVSSERQTRKRRGGKEVFSGSPSSIKVTETSSCSVNISFDLNTKKLWQDLHFPYGNYTAFFRHLILLEKFWRNGDLNLSETASEKSSVYIKSVYNRIRAYEGGRSNVKKSSLSSDVDLSASTRPDLSIPAAPLFLHEPPEEEEEEPKVVGKKDPPYKPAKDKQPEILKIPKVSLLARDSDFPPEADDDELSSPPTKIRVRTDLMHLGLIVKPVPNLMNEAVAASTAAANSTSITTTTATPSSSSSNAAEPTTPSVVPNPLASSSGGATKKMSPHTISSMLNDTPSNDPPPDKSCSSQHFNNKEQQSSAIPLTFNNSIAEVLEAANKATKASAKEASVSMALASKPEITITAKPLPPKQATTATTSSSSKAATRSPILDMTKLLQTQTPALPPHLVAQEAHIKPPAPPVVVRPPNPRMVRPQVQQKRTINNILDRLSGLKASPSTSVSSKVVVPPSSLVQQLQAPPQGLLPTSPPRMSGPQQQAAAAAAAAQQLMWAFNPAPPSGGQHMQYDWLSQTQALMMAGALPTLDQVQAAQRVQAFQELMNMGNKNPRMRAPPPLTHMGGGKGPGSGPPKTKNND